MYQTRQFTKRRPQSPLVQTNVDTLKVSQPVSSGLAIQANAPLHQQKVIHNETRQVQQQHQHHDNVHDHSHDHGHNHHGHHHDHSELNQVHNHQASQAHSHFEHNQVHDHHDHSHDHSHDHTHDHDHSHNHNHGHNHGHDLGHGHDHDHHGHNHDHDHNHSHSFPQVYTQPLPSLSFIFSSLTPDQRSVFHFFIAHALVGFILWGMGAVRGSLSIVGFSYLVLFDSFGTLNACISSVLSYHNTFSEACTKRPFGVKRFEVVFSLANTIFLLFGTMYTTKESLEHLLLDHHDDHHQRSFDFTLYFMLLVALAMTLISSTKFNNHEHLTKLLKRSSQTAFGQSYNVVNGPKPNLNMFSFSIVVCGGIVFLMRLFGMTGGSDKWMAFVESGLMIYLGGPTAAALAKVLLQTMPDNIMASLDHTLRELRQDPSIIAIDEVHFWQNAYSQYIGTARLQIRPDADEYQVLERSHNLLSRLTQGGELTLSVVKGGNALF